MIRIELKESKVLTVPIFTSYLNCIPKCAGSLDRAKIRDALAQTKDFHGATGNIAFDEHGDPKNKEVIIMKLGKKDQVYFKTIKPD